MADLSSPTGRRAVSMPLSATRPKFARQLDFEPLTTATDDSEELYNHINTRIYAIDVSKKRSPYWPTQSGEKLVATGVLVVQRKKPFGLVILSVGTQVSHTLFRRSKAWEVMTGMFCLRIDNTKYWRIEIRENSGGTLKADEFRDVLKKMISFETDECPFRRGPQLLKEPELEAEKTVVSPPIVNNLPVRKRVASISLADGQLNLPSFYRDPKPLQTLPPSRPRPARTVRQRSVSLAPTFERNISTKSLSPPYLTPEEVPQGSILSSPENRKENHNVLEHVKIWEYRTPPLTPPLSRRRGRDGPAPLSQPLTPIPQNSRARSPSNSASSHPTTPTLCHTSDFDFSPTSSDSDCDSQVWSPRPRAVSISHEKQNSPRAAQILSRTAGIITATVLIPSATLACFMLSIAGRVAKGALEVGTGKYEEAVAHTRGTYPGSWEDSIEDDGYIFQDDFGVDIMGRKTTSSN